MAPWHLDRTHSSIRFSVRHLMVSTVHGTFLDFRADVVFDSEHPELSSVAPTVVTMSVDTGDWRRNAHLCSPDFLDADQYATLDASPPIGSTTVLRTHALRRIRPLADSPTLRPPTGFAGLTWNVGLEARGLHTLTGDLTMHGVTQPVTFAAKYYGELDDERRDRCRGGVRARAGGGRRGDVRADRCRCDMTADVPRRLMMTGARRLVAAERARIEASRNARVSSRV